ncbi:hypothetical protein MC885_007995, partial [Smutsia gigantea]
ESWAHRGSGFSRLKATEAAIRIRRVFPLSSESVFPKSRSWWTFPEKAQGRTCEAGHYMETGRGSGSPISCAWSLWEKSFGEEEWGDGSGTSLWAPSAVRHRVTREFQEHPEPIVSGDKHACRILPPPACIANAGREPDSEPAGGWIEEAISVANGTGTEAIEAAGKV